MDKPDPTLVNSTASNTTNFYPVGTPNQKWYGIEYALANAIASYDRETVKRVTEEFVRLLQTTVLPAMEAFNVALRNVANAFEQANKQLSLEQEEDELRRSVEGDPTDTYRDPTANLIVEGINATARAPPVAFNLVYLA